MLPFSEAFADELEKLGGPLDAISPRVQSLLGWGAGLSALNVVLGDSPREALGGGFGGAAGWEAGQRLMPGRGVGSSMGRMAAGILGSELGSALLRKEASRLRKAITLSKKVMTDNKVYGRSVVRWDVNLAGKKVGQFMTSGNRVVHSRLDDSVRGMGLGKKVYGELARRMPGGKLRSDASVSDSAARVWEGMKGRKGYKAKKTVAGRLGVRDDGRQIALGPIYETQIAKKARKPEALPKRHLGQAVRDRTLSAVNALSLYASSAKKAK